MRYKIDNAPYGDSYERPACLVECWFFQSFRLIFKPGGAGCFVWSGGGGGGCGGGGVCVRAQQNQT
jgi:hypothetical protein